MKKRSVDGRPRDYLPRRDAPETLVPPVLAPCVGFDDILRQWYNELNRAGAHGRPRCGGDWFRRGLACSELAWRGCEDAPLNTSHLN